MCCWYGFELAGIDPERPNLIMDSGSDQSIRIENDSEMYHFFVIFGSYRSVLMSRRIAALLETI